ERHVAEATCLTVGSSSSGLVYTGHADGRVCVWRWGERRVIATVSVSVYRILCMSEVLGHQLWMGFSTGRIMVYDITARVWKLCKEWQAGEEVTGVAMCVDRLGAATMNGQIIVVTALEDGRMGVWDGLCLEDWVEGRMETREAEYVSYTPLTMRLVTWNIDARKPKEVDASAPDFVEHWVKGGDPHGPDLLFVGVQELVDLESKKVTASKSFLVSETKRFLEEDTTAHYRAWRDRLEKALFNACPHTSYELIHGRDMVGLSSWVYARSSVAAQISGVSACQVKTGFGGLHGNKGALVVRFLVRDTSVCWVNCHLAAGQSQTPQRNTDAANILRLSRLPAPPLTTVGSRHLWVDGGDGTRITDHAVGLWSGDLNYRISMDRTHVERAIQARDWSVLWAADQLRQQREANPLHALRSWTEPPLDFAPTYKYDRGSDTYDTSEKRRVPAWCDRILHRSTPQVKLRRSGWEVRASDHRPIAASFSLRVKVVDGPKE
ncbi:Endonuclease/exonuclease/phosphatase, partial [Piptocephalis cylindrospora]